MKQAAPGNLFLTSGVLVDRLPRDMIYKSSTDSGVYDPSRSTVTWSLGGATSLPQGCSSDVTAQMTGSARSPATYAVSAEVVATGSPLTDKATFTGVGAHGESATASATATIPVTAGPASQSALITISPAHQTHPSGGPQSYSISGSCEGEAGISCGPAMTVTIPLDTTTVPPMTDTSWTYSAKGPLPGLIVSGPTVVGDNLVIDLNDADFQSGDSGTITLQVTPPDDVTPNNTSWSVLPTLSGDSIPNVTAPTPAVSVATAAPQPKVSKVTANGGSVYLAGSDITYDITADCSSAATGNLYLSDGNLVDDLPAGFTYLSSSNGGVFDGVTDTVTWNFPTAASTPAGCAAGAAGATTYQVTLQAPSPAPPPADQPIINQTTFSGTGPDATNPDGVSASTTAHVPVEIVDTPPTGTGSGYATISKTSLAPLTQPGLAANDYVATYPGDWISTSTTPGYTVGAAAASFQATVDYGLVDSYQTDFVDPLPCLDDATGNLYTSAPYDAAPCASPAFNPTVIDVSSAGFDPPVNGLGAAVASGWRPEAILTNGSVIDLAPVAAVGASASSAHFTIPNGDVGQVATIELPPAPTLMNHSIQLTVWGYAAASLGSVNDSLNELTNVATAVPSLAGVPLAPVQADASILTVPPVIQLGISKSFGPLGGGPGGTTVVNIEGGVNFPTSLANNVVLADLLPLGLSWADPVAGGQFTLTTGSGTTSTVTATAQNLTDYEGSGRDLIRLTIPASDFTSSGTWKITPPADFLEVNTPTASGSMPTPTRSCSSACSPIRSAPVARHRRRLEAGSALRCSSRITPRIWRATAT